MIDTTYRWPMVVALVMMTVLIALSQNAKGAHESEDERKEADAVPMEVAPSVEVPSRR